MILPTARLLLEKEYVDPYLSIAKDYMNNTHISLDETDKMFCHYTNYPTEIILKEDAYIIVSNNSLFEKGLYNGSVGVVLKIVDEIIVHLMKWQ
ncbi:hypothetical protein Glove_461g30 [Diversispora epigaea]|uniref:Uncharacterized protein n=1 Tax=Diversispora epigaea TaxID=1348612 RepID=A0A397GMZ4_9GLOM|nr:hypothetical protein Glove_461g30 [Diversispora epigaea]